MHMKRHITWRLAAAITPVAALTGLAYAAGGPASASAGTEPAVPVAYPMARAILPADLPHTHLPSHSRADTANGTYTTNIWSGYAAVACATCHVRYAEAQFAIPSVNCTDSTIGTSGYALVADWVGLDGLTNGTVEQIGVNGYCTSTSSPATYYAWYEMYPLPPVAFTGVSPGDAIEADVYFNGSSYRLHLADITTRGFITTTQACPSGQTCQHTDAEVITEDPGGGVPQGYDLADFGQANFLNSQVTSLAGFQGNFGPANGYWTRYAVTMVNGTDVMATPGAVEGGAAFSVTWNASS
jgi:hypothetical protein